MQIRYVLFIILVGLKWQHLVLDLVNIQRVLGLAILAAQRAAVARGGQVVRLNVVAHVGRVNGLVTARLASPGASGHLCHEALHSRTVLCNKVSFYDKGIFISYFIVTIVS